MAEYIEREAAIEAAESDIWEVMPMPDISDTDRTLLRAYAAHNMNRAQTSKAIYLHSNSIRYRFDVIRRKTGLDPGNFYDLVKLLGIAEEKSG